MIDSLIRLNKKNYPRTLFEECKYKIKNNETENLINDDLEPSSSDKSDNGSDNKFYNEPNKEFDNYESKKSGSY